MRRGRKTRFLFSGAIIASLFSSSAFAATEKEKELERRIEALESAFGSVKTELQTTRSALETSQAENSRLMKSITAVETKASETATKVAVVEKTAPPAKGFRVGNTTITLGGYVKFDALASSFSGGDPAANSLINDYYFPAQIPVGGRGEGVNLTTSVRETRILIQTETQIGDKKANGHIELDFLDTPLIGNQRVSNSFVPRIRRAFITYDKLTFGQDWSTFQNPAALPERLDFVGPTEGTVFERQPLIRYKSGDISIALENPETTVTQGTTSAESDDDVAPDVVLRFDKKWKKGSLAIAGIGRILKVDNSGAPSPIGALGTIDDTAIGWGVSASGVYESGPSRFTAMATVGEGIGRYVGLNIRDDVLISPTNQLDTPLLYAGFVSYRYAFAGKWKAIGTLSGFKSETPGFASRALTKSVYSGNIDFLYSPIKPLILGFGFRYAERTLENGLSGKLRRAQFSAQYNF
jgi:hypothetical protein